ncbi:MAG: hypothetical protein Tsb002_24690 [Wenzhouxiangellaceae bacterium]
MPRCTSGSGGSGIKVVLGGIMLRFSGVFATIFYRLSKVGCMFCWLWRRVSGEVVSFGQRRLASHAAQALAG